MAWTARARTITEDPWDALAAAEGPCMFFARGDTAVLHEGVSVEVTATGPRRCVEVRNQVRATHVEYDGPRAARPRWLGGLSFFDDHEPQGAWSGFPSARFCLPARQRVWVAEGAFETTIDPVAEVRNGKVAATPLPASRQDDWQAAVATAHDAIVAGNLTKVVLSRCREQEARDAIQVLRRLAPLEPHARVFFIRNHDAVFYGLSPETLVYLEDGRVESHALAGSAAHRDGEDPSVGQGLLASQKDILEHELVAAFLRERMAEAGVFDIRQQPRRLLRLRTVQHIETPLEGRAPRALHILDIARHLHPSPAVAGTPRSKAMDLIRTLEPYERGWYTGAIGWFDGDGEGRLNVALRCALQVGDKEWSFAGAGIVAGSDPEQEWLETETKMQGLA